jgi:hypothetical protein
MPVKYFKPEKIQVSIQYMKIKKNLVALLPLFFTGLLFAQDKDEKQGCFRKDHVYIGSSLNLGFSSGIFQVGANPEIGYSIAKWLDAGVSTNINYSSYRYTIYSDQIFNYGVGGVVRIWPARFMFLSAIPEYNWVNVNRKFVNNSPSIKDNYNAGSLLLGAGYGSRVVGRMYSYFALMFDALSNENSPYRDAQNRAVPIVRAGFAFYLKP